MMPKTIWHAEQTKSAAARGYSTATDVADYLARQGVPFREAHEVVGGLVGIASRSGRQLWELTDAELKAAHPLLNAEVAQNLTVEESVKNRASYGGTAPERVREAIADARKKLEG
jgi:argininosuccinate lyase